MPGGVRPFSRGRGVFRRGGGETAGDKLKLLL